MSNLSAGSGASVCSPGANGCCSDLSRRPRRRQLLGAVARKGGDLP